MAAAKVKTPAERAKDYRDRRREKVAVPRENVAPAKLERPAAVTEAPPEVAQLGAADLEAPAAALAGDALPAAAVDALKASVAETPLGAPPPDAAVAAAAAAPPSPGDVAMGDQLAQLTRWGCDQALARHQLPDLVRAVFASPMLVELARSSGVELARKYGLGGKLKLPCEAGVAVALGVTAWGAFGPPMGKATKRAAADEESEAPDPTLTPPVPLAAPWAQMTGPEGVQ